MNYRNIKCANCGCLIGHYPVFSHTHDEEDTGDAEYTENYEGAVEGEDYCFNCYEDVLRELEGETECDNVE
jgi:hypothetical protein